ncbi:TolC family protein [Geoalkalibacter sp.]|uniref:TolC family protein n=1 Tax=Geoalkalibacter sp. TaxID=3041440 RepID=UPI00272E8848|nr:TolC family protein [Geoalkalibacter sp.]
MPEFFRRAATAALAVVCLALAHPWTASADVSPEIGGGSKALTLQEALAETLLHSPDLQAFALEIRAREAEALQAGLRPNPLLSLEAENLFGSGEFSGVDAAETTLSVSQTLELGGKRGLRRELADAETRLAQGEYAQREAQALAVTTEAFLAVLVAQERLALAEALIEPAEKILDQVRERIVAGKTAETEQLRVRIHLRELQGARERSKRELAAAREQLAARLGRDRVDFGPVVGDLATLFAPPRPMDLEKHLEVSPVVRQRALENERRAKLMNLEQARRIPNVDIEVGARYLRHEEDLALVVGLSVPLPLFDRNQGSIAAARHRLTQARTEERDAFLITRASVIAAGEELAAAHADIAALRDEILPAAHQALQAMEYGYQAGKFGLLDVLDAQRTLVEAQRAHLEALAAFHRAGVELDRLLGGQWRASAFNQTSSAFVQE